MDIIVFIVTVAIITLCIIIGKKQQETPDDKLIVFYSKDLEDVAIILEIDGFDIKEFIKKKPDYIRVETIEYK